MRQIFTNNAPVSALAAAGVCTVAPDSRLQGISVTVVSPLTARFPQVHQAKGSYMAPETKPSIAKLGGFRGVPPRGRPV